MALVPDPERASGGRQRLGAPPSPTGDATARPLKLRRDTVAASRSTTQMPALVAAIAAGAPPTRRVWVTFALGIDPVNQPLRVIGHPDVVADRRQATGMAADAHGGPPQAGARIKPADHSRAAVEDP